ncbi:hypothetical protein C5N92_07530 [Glaesserella australis]|uniref:Addiction module toxin, HicA family n=1 Tax=Glaesserella australis TaxID=2094024 RepID=A0A328C213_9PAST|nr:hypothetical protein CJD39_01240 [Glaesserella sp. 15-184]RAL18554.1 hypothetical protein C5N92_07530 [Glaesserella australis]
MCTKYSSNKDINQLIKGLVKVGWWFHRRSKHSELWSPDRKQRIFISVSPSDKRAYMKLKSNLRRIGFIVER